MIPAQRIKPKTKTNNNPYLAQKVLSASPEQLISYILDAGITACGQQNRDKATRAVQLLIKSLNFDYKETSMTFYNVYRYINHIIGKGNFAEAKKNLEEIKAAWTQAHKVV